MLDKIKNAFYGYMSGDGYGGEEAERMFFESVQDILKSSPTCGEGQRKFLDNIERLQPHLKSTQYNDPYNPTEYRDLIDLCKFCGVSTQKVMQGK